jgi:hypothetical protein
MAVGVVSRAFMKQRGSWLGCFDHLLILVSRRVIFGLSSRLFPQYIFKKSEHFIPDGMSYSTHNFIIYSGDRQSPYDIPSGAGLN